MQNVGNESEAEASNLWLLAFVSCKQGHENMDFTTLAVQCHCPAS